MLKKFFKKIIDSIDPEASQPLLPLNSYDIYEDNNNNHTLPKMTPDEEYNMIANIYKQVEDLTYKNICFQSFYYEMCSKIINGKPYWWMLDTHPFVKILYRKGVRPVDVSIPTIKGLSVSFIYDYDDVYYCIEEVIELCKKHGFTVENSEDEKMQELQNSSIHDILNIKKINNNE